MRYLSICSGIESASVAWKPLNWQAVAYAEIEPFPCAVLHHHYGSARPLRMPDPSEPGIPRKEARRRAAMIKGVAYLPETQSSNGVPNLGDFTQIQASDLRSDIDLLVGGTPCQDFSVAGLRAGLDGSRGNLTLEFLRLAQRLRPRWLVWENVPGVLSNNGGRDFGAILGGMVELGFGFAYRVLDAQYVRTFGLPWAVPQRRRRVFVVGYLGDWRPAAAVFFDRESLSGNPPPRREAGQAVAGTLAARSGGGGWPDGGDGRHDQLIAFGGNNQSGPIDVATAQTAQTAHGGSGRFDFESETFIAFSSKDHGGDALVNVAPTMRAMNSDGSHANAGGQIAIAFDTTQITSGENRCNPQPGDPCHPIPAHGHAPAIAFNARQDPDVFDGHTGPFDTDGSTQAVMSNWRVRRLMPIECERLQGFPDGYTDVPYRGRPNAPDGPRYKALGNSKATNCVEWLGERIDAVDKIVRVQRMEAAE
jgi:DNA (cytosine-5)-methyltransferase 1